MLTREEVTAIYLHVLQGPKHDTAMKASTKLC